ncbi:hypothetical protein [Hankyongella ginsenosidimutans]|uniref:hypothetical protein n=1 Tax=Hankyongella ginsenosidimutans TaxID=1763828 RepID=UPI00319DDC07
MSTLDFEDPSTEGAEPLDLFEHCCHARGWAFERDGDEELMVAAPGSWGPTRCVFSGARTMP